VESGSGHSKTQALAFSRPLPARFWNAVVFYRFGANRGVAAQIPSLKSQVQGRELECEEEDEDEDEDEQQNLR
jgi:hypothetical protein